MNIFYPLLKFFITLHICWTIFKIFCTLCHLTIFVTIICSLLDFIVYLICLPFNKFTIAILGFMFYFSGVNADENDEFAL